MPQTMCVRACVYIYYGLAVSVRSMYEWLEGGIQIPYGSLVWQNINERLQSTISHAEPYCFCNCECDSSVTFSLSVWYSFGFQELVKYSEHMGLMA